jgi:hypothetical protein
MNDKNKVTKFLSVHKNALKKSPKTGNYKEIMYVITKKSKYLSFFFLIWRRSWR